MKKLTAILAILMLVFTAAYAEALPVENPAAEERNAEMTFADVLDTESIQVAGPGMSRLFVENYIRENPEIIWDMFRYLEMLEAVQTFTETYPEAENYNTYDLATGEVMDLQAGYCVTFHQNLAADDPFGGYTPEVYAAMIAITLNELGAETVNVGYFGNTEISFVCMDKEVALRFAIRHNQNSIYCVSTEETEYNPKYNSELNPILGVE